MGHALITALKKDAEPVQKITIVPRTMGSLGYVMQVPEEEKYLMTKDELMARLLSHFLADVLQKRLYLILLQPVHQMILKRLHRWQEP